MKHYLKILIMALTVILSAFKSEGQLSLSLRDAFKCAAKANRELQIQRLEILRSGEQLKESRSFWLPSISGSANYNYYFDRQNIFMPGSFTNSAKPVVDIAVGGRHAVSAVISGSQPIINSVINDKMRVSVINDELQKEKLKDVESKLALAIAQHYLAILLQQEQLQLLHQSLERNQQALKDARSFFLQGKNLKTDTLQNFIGVQNAQAGISALNSNVSVLLLQLKQLIGVGESDTLILTDVLAQQDLSADVFEDPIAVIAFNNRKDIRMQELVVEQRRQEQSMAKSEFKPQLWAVGQYQVQSQADNLKLDAWPRTSFVGVALTVPIYSGKRSKYKQNQAHYAFHQEQLALQELKSKVNTELVSLTSQLTEANKQLSIHSHSVLAAQISYTMMGDRYKHGLASRLELTDAELALTQAKMNQLQAAYNVKMITIRLEHAAGKLTL
jgi:outer membrane protein